MIMNQGRIVKNYMGYYYVETAMHEIITCKVKGKMKQNRFSLCTGDYVKFEVSGSEGMITDILPRKNFLLRPTVANIDLVVVTVSCSLTFGARFATRLARKSGSRTRRRCVAVCSRRTGILRRTMAAGSIWMTRSMRFTS